MAKGNPSTWVTPRRQCTARSKRSGERCRSYAVRGASVCVRHGGAAPQVKAKARERLDALAEPAVVLLGRILRDEKVEPNARIRAAVAILDRAGYPGGLKVEASASLVEWQQILRNLADEQAAVERRPRRARRVAVEAGPPLSTGDVIEGEATETFTEMFHKTLGEERRRR
jgi:hypothetical protein